MDRGELRKIGPTMRAVRCMTSGLGLDIFRLLIFATQGTSWWTYHQPVDAAVWLSTRASGRARSSSGAPRRQAIPALAHSPQDTPLLQHPGTLRGMTAAARLTDPTTTHRHACFQRGGSALLEAERVFRPVIGGFLINRPDHFHSARVLTTWSETVIATSHRLVTHWLSRSFCFHSSNIDLFGRIHDLFFLFKVALADVNIWARKRRKQGKDYITIWIFMSILPTVFSIVESKG